MATKAEARPGVSKYDTQPRKVIVDYALNEVDPGSDAAAFSYLASDLERVRASREELGLANDKERSQRESREAEMRRLEREMATLQARLEGVRAAAADAADTTGTDKAIRAANK